MPTLQQLHDSLHVGAETELGGTLLKLWDDRAGAFVEPPYGITIAATQGAGDFGLDHFAFQPDQVSKATKSALIEIVGGARKTTDFVFEQDLREACQILIETLKEPRTFTFCDQQKRKGLTVPLWHVLEQFNARLKLKPDLAKFCLSAVPQVGQQWYVGPSKNIKGTPQMNFEVPLRNVGHLPTSVDDPRDLTKVFRTDAGSLKLKNLFAIARKRANVLVDTTFHPRAVAYHAGATPPEPTNGIKLEKLRSIFTLYYYIRAMEQTKANPTKDMYEIMPKVGVNDLIRTALTARDLAILAQVTTNAVAFATLKSQMNDDILLAVQAMNASFTKQRLRLNELDALHDAVFLPMAGHARYNGELATTYGAGISASAPNPLDDEAHYAVLSNRPDTPTYKALQVNKYAYDKAAPNGGVPVQKLEPVIVFETRHETNAFSQFGDCTKLVKVLTKIHGRIVESEQHKQAVKGIINVQKPYPRDAKSF